MKSVRWGIFVGLIAILWLQWRNWPVSPDLPPFMDPPGTAGAATSVEQATDLLSRLDRLEDRLAYSEVSERPLFQPDRRPPSQDPVEEPEMPVADDTALDGLDLTAIIMTPEWTVAWVRSRQAPPALIRVRVGDDLLGWAVREILGDRLVLERHGQANTLLLREYSTSNVASSRQAARAGRPPARVNLVLNIRSSTSTHPVRSIDH